MLKILLLPGLESLSLGFPHAQNIVGDYVFGIWYISQHKVDGIA